MIAFTMVNPWYSLRLYTLWSAPQVSALARSGEPPRGIRHQSESIFCGNPFFSDNSDRSSMGMGT